MRNILFIALQTLLFLFQASTWAQMPAIHDQQFRKKLAKQHNTQNTVFINYNFGNCNVYVDDFIYNLNITNKKKKFGFIVDYKYLNYYKNYLRESECFQNNKIIFIDSRLFNDYHTNLPFAFYFKNHNIITVQGTLNKILNTKTNALPFDSIPNFSLSPNPNKCAYKNLFSYYCEEKNKLFWYQNGNLDSADLDKLFNKVMDDYYSNMDIDSVERTRIKAARDTIALYNVKGYSLISEEMQISNNIQSGIVSYRYMHITKDSIFIDKKVHLFSVDLMNKKFTSRDFTFPENMEQYAIIGIRSISGMRFAATIIPREKAVLKTVNDSFMICYAEFDADMKINKINVQLINTHIDTKEFLNITDNLNLVSIFQRLNDTLLCTQSSNKLYNLNKKSKPYILPFITENYNNALLFTKKVNNKYLFYTYNYENRLATILTTEDFISYKIKQITEDIRDKVLLDINDEGELIFVKTTSTYFYLYKIAG